MKWFPICHRPANSSNASDQKAIQKMPDKLTAQTKLNCSKWGSTFCAPIPDPLRSDSLIRTHDAINGIRAIEQKRQAEDHNER